MQYVAHSRAVAVCNTFLYSSALPQETVPTSWTRHLAVQRASPFPLVA
jgi:hypothetical protein